MRKSLISAVTALAILVTSVSSFGRLADLNDLRKRLHDVSIDDATPYQLARAIFNTLVETKSAGRDGEKIDDFAKLVFAVRPRDAEAVAKKLLRIIKHNRSDFPGISSSDLRRFVREVEKRARQDQEEYEAENEPVNPPESAFQSA